MILSVILRNAQEGTLHRTLSDGSIQVDVFTLDMPFVGDGVRGTDIYNAAKSVYIRRYHGLTRVHKPNNALPVLIYQGWHITLEDETGTPCVNDSRLYRQVYLVARKPGDDNEDHKQAVILMVEGRYRDGGRQPALRQEIFTYLSERIVNAKPYHERND